MSKVITFSRTFPAYHPKAGQPTYFVEKIYQSIGWINCDYDRQFDPRLSLDMVSPKHHTIRAGSRWKVGDKFSPRVWSGKPYNSKQITIAPDIEIKKVWEFKISKYADGYWIDFGSYHVSENFASELSIMPLLSKNDGLEFQDLLAWFKFPSPFSGQIICWNESVNY